jgi:hypothetical protein
LKIHIAEQPVRGGSIYMDLSPSRGGHGRKLNSISNFDSNVLQLGFGEDPMLNSVWGKISAATGEGRRHGRAGPLRAASWADGDTRLVQEKKREEGNRKWASWRIWPKRVLGFFKKCFIFSSF